MSIAMKREQIGSAISQPKYWTNSEEMMTPTLPKVSANTWRNTPKGGEKGREREKQKTYSFK